MRTDNRIFRPSVPYSQKRYSNAAATLSGVFDASKKGGPEKGVPASSVTLKVIVSPQQYGSVKYEVNAGIEPLGGKKITPGQAVKKRYSEYSTNSSLTNQTLNITVPVGGYVWLTASPKEGCYFDTWSDGVKAVSRKVTPSSDMTLTARFKQKNVNTVTYYTVAVQCSPAEGGSVTGNGLVNGQASVKAGDSIRLTATPKSGYVFKTWRGITPGAYNINLSSSVINLPVDRNHALVAVFDPLVKDPTPNNGGNGGGSNDEPKPNDEAPLQKAPISGGSNGKEPYNGGSDPELPNSDNAVGSGDTFDKVVAFARKWWWAILIALYIIYKEKGAKE